MKLPRFLILSFVLVLCFSCAPKVENFPSLANQGPLALSTTNPYLGANLFLSRELEQSSYLFNFFKGRGAPAAMEIVQERFHPTRILLYYPRDKEVYAGDLLVERSTAQRQWVVRGPYAISRRDYKDLQSMDMAMNGEPVFEIWGKPYRFRFQKEESSSEIRPVIPLPPPPTPKPRKKVIYKGTESGVSKEPAPPAVPTSPSGEFRPLNADQQALQMAKGFAERAENGDVVHTVKSSSETLSALAKWYTGSATAAAEIGSYNGIAETDILSEGKRVRIPMKNVKQFKAMPADFK